MQHIQPKVYYHARYFWAAVPAKVLQMNMWPRFIQWFLATCYCYLQYVCRLVCRVSAETGTHLLSPAPTMVPPGRSYSGYSGNTDKVGRHLWVQGTSKFYLVMLKSKVFI